MLHETLIAQIQDAVRGEPQILAVYVFGSFAQDRSVKESDFDLAVVVENKKKVNESAVYELLKGISFPKNLDIVVVDRGSSPLLLFEIVAKGLRVFSKSEEETVSFEANVLKMYYDTAHTRNIYYQYLKEKFPLPHHDSK